MNKIALGTVQFGLDYGISNSSGITTPGEQQKILEVAKEGGITKIDTALGYGSSEANLGELNTSHFQIISKFPQVHPGQRVSDYLNASLENLQVQSLYGYIAHSSDVILKNPSVYDELKQLKDAGKVKKIGYSIYQPSELEELLSKGCIPDLVQIPYNPFDRRFESVLHKLKELDTEIHTRSAFLQGLFFKDVDTLPNFFNPVKDILNLFHEALPDVNQKAGALLNFAIKNPLVDQVVIGVNSSNQLISNLEHCEMSYNLPSFHELVPHEIITPYLWPNK